MLRQDELFKNFKCPCDDPRLNELARELRRLSSIQDSLKYYSIAYCLLMRAFLEWSLINYIKAVGEEVPKDNNGRYKGLHSIVDYCLENPNLNFDRRPPNEKLRAIKEKWINELHLATHTEFGNYSEPRLKEMIADIKPLISYVLNEI